MRNGRLSEQKHGPREAGLSVSAAMDSQCEFCFDEGCFPLLKYFKTFFFQPADWARALSQRICPVTPQGEREPFNFSDQG